MAPARLFLLLAIVSMVAAGCLSAQDDAERAKGAALRRGAPAAPLSFDNEWFAHALPNGGEHNHKDLAHHQQLSTPNFEVVGWDPLVTDYHGKAAGGYFCGDVSKAKEGRRLAVVHSWVSDVGFVLLDITDPTNPKKISEMLLENSHVYDLSITPNQKYVLLGTIHDGQNYDAGKSPVGPPILHSTDACTGKTTTHQGPETGLPYASGLVLVDIANPRTPRIVDFRHFPIIGSHSVVSTELNGRTIGVSTVENIPGEASYYVFFEVIETPADGKIQLLTIYHRAQVNQEELSKLTWNNHDVFLEKHPVTGAQVAYLADGNNGMLVLNIDDPRQPRLLARWADWPAVGGFHSSHYIHSVITHEGLWDGKHYLFMSEECTGRPPKTPSCLVYVMDVTDPSKPLLAGAWTFPHDAGPWQYPGFSMHYMAIVNRTLFVSAFHAGVWALDVSSPEKIRDLNTIGVFLPDRAPPKGFLKDHNYHRSPATADVMATGDGHIITFEETSGAYVLRFDPSQPAPRPAPWAIPGSFYGNP